MVTLPWGVRSSCMKCVRVPGKGWDQLSLQRSHSQWAAVQLCVSTKPHVWGRGWALPFLSADVNFALELSDLRHRHGFHIILVHKNQASEALLHHANELIRFEEFISDLPPRLPLKMPVSGFAFFFCCPRC